MQFQEPDRGAPRKPKLFDQVRQALYAPYTMLTVPSRPFHGFAAPSLPRQASPPTLRRFATHLLSSGYDICVVQELLGHKDMRPTMISTHVLERGLLGVRSPLDDLD